MTTSTPAFEQSSRFRLHVTCIVAALCLVACTTDGSTTQPEDEFAREEIDASASNEDEEAAVVRMDARVSASDAAAQATRDALI